MKKKTHPSHKKITLVGKVRIESGYLNPKETFGIALNSPPLYQYFLKNHCKPGDDISMTLESKRPKRSDSQNNYYHLYLSLISLSSGHTMDELKTWVRGKILGKGITEVFGDKVRVTKSSADLNISEFLEMIDRIQDLTGVPAPDTKPFNLALTNDEFNGLKADQREKYKAIKGKKIKM